jgi:hypothetical protein
VNVANSKLARAVKADVRAPKALLRRMRGTLPEARRSGLRHLHERLGPVVN